MRIARARHREHGQASVEWIAAVGLVAGAMAAAAAAWVDPSGIAHAVVRELGRAICVVSGGDCEGDREPCLSASERRSQSRGARLGLVRIGEDRVVVREDRSDGTSRLALLNVGRGGLDAALAVRLRGLELGTVGSALLAEHGEGMTFEVATSEADRVQQALREGDGRVPAAAGRLDGWSATGHLDVRLPVAGRILSLDAAVARGTAVAADGSRTIALRRAATTGGLLGGVGGGEDEVLLRIDRHGRAQELVVASQGELSGAAGLPAVLAPVAGRLLAARGSGGPRVWAAERHLDLRDPDHSAAAAAYVEALRDPRRAVLASAAAGVRPLLDRAGTVEARSYEVARSEDSDGLVVGAVGYEAGGSEERRRLLTAVSRGYDGNWHVREDCAAR